MLRIGPRRSKGSQEVGLERLIFCVLYFTFHLLNLILLMAEIPNNQLRLVGFSHYL